MRDRDYFDDEYERGRGSRRVIGRESGGRELSPRDVGEREGYSSRGYQSREGYQPPTLREGYDRNYDRGLERGVERGVERGLDRGYDRDYDRGNYRGENFDRFSAGRESVNRYESRYEPRYSYDRSEYADRDRQEWSPTTREKVSRSVLRCRDIMTKDVVACRRDTNLREVSRVMRDEDTGVVPVVDDHDRVIGVVTDRDIVVRILGDKDLALDTVTVADAMTDEVYSVRPTDRVVDAIRKMGDKQVRRIIVTDDNNRLKGIISMSDVATEAEYDRELEDAIEEISKPKSWFKRLFS
jgi:CBS domain-containing protein